MSIEERYIKSTQEQWDLFISPRVDISNGAMILFPSPMYKISKIIGNYFSLVIEREGKLITTTISVDPNKLCPEMADIFLKGLKSECQLTYDHVVKKIEANLTPGNRIVDFSPMELNENE